MVLVRLRRSRSGATATEFAMIMVPTLMLVFGVIEFARLTYTRNALQQLSIETARCMGVRGAGCINAAGDYSAARVMASVAAGASARSITIPASGIVLDTAASCSGIPGFSRSTLSVTFKTVAPGLLKVFGQGVNLSATACYPNQ